MTEPLKEFAKRFAKLLTKAIKRISIETEMKIEDVQNEIGEAIGKSGSLIEYWRRGFLPSTLADLASLGRELVKRGGLQNRKELEELLRAGGHPYPSILNKELFPQKIDVDSGFLYKRLKMDIKRQISVDGKVTSVYQTEIQATSNSPLPSIRHRRFTQTKFEDWRLEFIPGQRERAGEMRKQIVGKSEKLLEWTVEFNPPLRKDEKVSYSHIQTCWGTHAMSYEQCKERFVAGHSLGKYEYWRIKIAVPTERLRMILEFPPNYFIEKPLDDEFSVYLDSSKHLDEIARLRAQGAFSEHFNNDTNQWTFELTVQPALVGLGYQLQWIPPRESSINP